MQKKRTTSPAVLSLLLFQSFYIELFLEFRKVVFEEIIMPEARLFVVCVLSFNLGNCLQNIQSNIAAVI